MNKRDEMNYQRGLRQAWSDMLYECLSHLGVDEASLPALALEREQAIAVLRELCQEFGDNDWPDDLALPDIIDKHLGAYLRK